MRKFLMISTVALLASTIGASAGSGTTRIMLDGTGDIFAITWHGDRYAEIHDKGDLTLGAGVGMSVPTKSGGKTIVISDSYPNNGSYYVCYEFQGPFKTGNQWSAYYTDDGVKVHELGSGTYTVE
jgi:hypothetical protein